MLSASLMLLVTALAFYILHALFIRRLTRKNYRTFRVAIMNEDGELGRRLLFRQGVKVWLRVLCPQLSVILLVVISAGMAGSLQSEALTRAIKAFWPWLQVLVAGPYSIANALRAKYRGFCLQAYGHRYI
jgi:hypothetical protein